MNRADPSGFGTVVTPVMVHDLLNFLSIAYGHSELLAMDLPPDDPSRPPIVEIRNACEGAIQLVRGWTRSPTSESE